VAKEGGAVAAETQVAAGIIAGAKANKIATRAKPIDIVRIAFPLVSRDRCQHGGVTNTVSHGHRPSNAVMRGDGSRRIERPLKQGNTPTSDSIRVGATDRDHANSLRGFGARLGPVADAKNL
jgi:hypothetical protein